MASTRRSPSLPGSTITACRERSSITRYVFSWNAPTVIVSTFTALEVSCVAACADVRALQRPARGLARAFALHLLEARDVFVGSDRGGSRITGRRSHLSRQL